MDSVFILFFIFYLFLFFYFFLLSERLVQAKPSGRGEKLCKLPCSPSLIV